jgi:predicted nucleic acid-binding protein
MPFVLHNILVVNELPKRVTEFGALRTDPIPDEGAVLRLARTRLLTVYDAAYLELAQREGVLLI